MCNVEGGGWRGALCILLSLRQSERLAMSEHLLAPRHALTHWALACMWCVVCALPEKEREDANAHDSSSGIGRVGRDSPTSG
jgi:hypothetical protein